MWLLTWFSVLIWLSQAMASKDFVGYQSVEQGFAGGMVVHPSQSIVYVTGSARSVERVRIDDQRNDNDDNEDTQWECLLYVLDSNTGTILSEELLGTPHASHVCPAVQLSSNPQQVYVVGSQQGTNGLLEPLRATGSLDATVSGMVLDWTIHEQHTLTLKGGRLLHDYKTQYPVALATPDDEYVYVVSMATDDDSLSVQYQAAAAEARHAGTLVNPLDVRQYGNKYTLFAERLRVRSVPPDHHGIQETLQTTWKRPFETNQVTPVLQGDDPIHPSVYVTGMITFQGSLLIVGYTTGLGTAFGDANQTHYDGTMDGFVTQLSADTGDLLQARRVSSGDEDYLYAICTDAQAGDIYIVGSTTGILDTAVSTSPQGSDAFVQKLNADLNVQWTQQLPSNGVVEARSCAVTNDGERLYVAGVAEKGASMAGTTTKGDDDIFCAQLNTRDGTIQFVRQVGTSANDQLAKSGGVATDADGNALLLGTTQGSFSRIRTDDDDQSNIFLTLITREDGLVQITAEADPSLYSPTSPPLVSSDSSKRRVGGTEIWAFLLFLVLVIALTFFHVQRVSSRRRKDAIYTSRSKLYGYLQEFDLEDMDLRHSATGGWHGSYANELADGFNKVPTDDRLASPSTPIGMSDSSQRRELQTPLTGQPDSLQDSLFMDHQETPKLGDPTKTYSDLADTNDPNWKEEVASLRLSRNMKALGKDKWGREII